MTALLLFLIGSIINVGLILTCFWVFARARHPGNLEAALGYLALSFIAYYFGAMRGSFDAFAGFILGPFYLLIMLGIALFAVPNFMAGILALSAGSIFVFLKLSKRLTGSVRVLGAIAVFFLVAILSAEIMTSVAIERARWASVDRAVPHCFIKRSALAMLTDHYVDTLRAPHASITTDKGERLHYSFDAEAFELTASTIARGDIPDIIDRCGKDNLYLP